ncbi:MAG: hypothetical protein ABIG28_03040 [archaeon]
MTDENGAGEVVSFLVGRVDRWENYGFKIGVQHSDVYQVVADGRVVDVGECFENEQFWPRNEDPEVSNAVGYCFANDLRTSWMVDGRLPESERKFGKISTFEVRTGKDILVPSDKCRKGLCESIDMETLMGFRGGVVEQLRRYGPHLEEIQ